MSYNFNMVYIRVLTLLGIFYNQISDSLKYLNKTTTEMLFLTIMQV